MLYTFMSEKERESKSERGREGGREGGREREREDATFINFLGKKIKLLTLCNGDVAPHLLST